MPKVIKDLQEQILQSATELFGQHGYHSTDIKMISGKTGIAVGTIYNYFPNKKQLYISVLKRNWSNIFRKLEDICQRIKDPDVIMQQTIEILYSDMDKKTGLGKIFFRAAYEELLKDPDIIHINTTIVSKIANIFRLVGHSTDTDPKINNRLAETLIVAICVLLAAHPQEKEENIYFLNKIASFVIKTE
jgi:AcrR family transcriptional regulator